MCGVAIIFEKPIFSLHKLNSKDSSTFFELHHQFQEEYENEYQQNLWELILLRLV